MATAQLSAVGNVAIWIACVGAGVDLSLPAVIFGSEAFVALTVVPALPLADQPPEKREQDGPGKSAVQSDPTVAPETSTARVSRLWPAPA